MPRNYNVILEKLRRWKSNETQTLSNGTVLICKVPHIAPQAWLHRLYGPLTEEKISQLDSKLTKKLPKDFRDFLSNFNGVNIFSDSISIWGVKTSYVRTGEEAFQPYDLCDLNDEKSNEISDEWLVFGSYSWNGSYMVYNINRDIEKVFRCDNDSNEILQEWPDLFTWLSGEIDRLSLLFDENGVEYDEDTPTIPEV